MSLFDKIAENPYLHFVDESNPNREFTLQNLNLHSFTNDEKKLVFLYLDNSIESITAFFSVLKSSHAMAMLSADLAENFKTELEKIYTPAFIFDKKRTQIKEYIFSDNFFTKTNYKTIEIHPSVKVLLSTSGTTGSPKFVKISEENLWSNATAIAAYLSIRPTDVTPLNLPIYYSYGLSVLTSNSLKGGKIMCGNIDVLNRSFWNNMEKFGYTSIAGVPFVYEMLDRIGFTRKKYPSLLYFTQAGGKLQNNLVKKFADYAAQQHIRFYVMYGQTEATARMAYLPPEKLQEKTGSIGIPIPGGKLFVSQENNELCYEGPNIFGGYVTAPDDLKTFAQPKILYTGDLASMDDDGFFSITGRLKRFVKLFGNRVNLDELESLLTKNFGVTCKCAGDNDKKLFIAADNMMGKENDIKNYIIDELKIHPSVIKIQQVNEIPLTPNGKVDYTSLLVKYAN